MKEKYPISKNLIVACQIYDLTSKGEKVGFTKIVKSLRSKVSKSTILKSLDTLSDYGIIKTEFGETENGRAGRIYSVAGESEIMVKQICDKFWREITIK